MTPAEQVEAGCARQLADAERLVALMRTARRIDKEQIRALWKRVRELEALLARLDAPVTPGEPGAPCGTCKGTRTRYVSIGAFGEVVADRPCPDCTASPPRSPEAPDDGECHCKHCEVVAEQRAREEARRAAARSPEAKACERCGGRGIIAMHTITAPFDATNNGACHACNGTGLNPRAAK